VTGPESSGIIQIMRMTHVKLRLSKYFYAVYKVTGLSSYVS